MRIDPRAHYWIVGTSPDVVYSSGTNTYNPANDSAFVEWRRRGGVPSQILNEAELWGSLLAIAPGFLSAWLFNGETFVQPSVGAYTKAQLCAYAAAKRYQVETGGVTISGMPIATDRESQALVNGAFNFVQIDPTRTFQFKAKNGFVVFNADSIRALAVGVASHVQACFAIEASVFAKIVAGSLTTIDAIDAEFGAVQ